MSGSSLRFAVRPVAGGGGPPLLAVDFEPLSQEPSLSSRLAERGSARPIHGVDAVADLIAAPAVVDLPAMALAYAHDVRRTVAGDRITVVGFCSGAPLAAFISAELSASYEVRTHLVQPTWPTEETAVREFMRFRRDMGVRDADPIRFDDLLGDPRGRYLAMADVLRADLEAALGRMRVVNAAVRAMYESLLSRYLAWLAFLTAGSAAPLHQLHKLPADALIRVAVAEEDALDVLPPGWTPPFEFDRYAVGSAELVTHIPFLDALLSWKGEA
ncbi:MAG: hypothetical protein JF587_18220 [Catenulisporales bacterium]|nr:hypothetical protein [Catenulisporales bacterium]